MTILNAVAWIARLGDEQWQDLLWEFGADTYRLGCRSSDLLEAEHQRLQVHLRELAHAVSRETQASDLIKTLADKAGWPPG